MEKSEKVRFQKESSEKVEIFHRKWRKSYFSLVSSLEEISREKKT